jgi:D-glycero-beta-D-manno-heptose 1-phosphate adenylyltransferase
MGSRSHFPSWLATTKPRQDKVSRGCETGWQILRRVEMAGGYREKFQSRPFQNPNKLKPNHLQFFRSENPIPLCYPESVSPAMTRNLSNSQPASTHKPNILNPFTIQSLRLVNAARALHFRIQPSALIHWKSVTRLYTREELVSQRESWRREGKTVVFTNGCYDLLHPGHIRLLEQARSLGDVLILALNSDASVRLSKGPNRPLIPEGDRAALAAALEAVDAVTLFDEETPRQLVAAVLPDILVKGADWSHFIAGREEVEAAGGKVMTVPLEPGYSTTNIVERILA